MKRRNAIHWFTEFAAVAYACCGIQIFIFMVIIEPSDTIGWRLYNLFSIAALLFGCLVLKVAAEQASEGIGAFA